MKLQGAARIPDRPHWGREDMPRRGVAPCPLRRLNPQTIARGAGKTFPAPAPGEGGVRGRAPRSGVQGAKLPAGVSGQRPDTNVEEAAKVALYNTENF